MDLEALAFPGLTAMRRDLIARVEKLATVAPKRALAALGLNAGQAAEIERNRDLLNAPAAPAGEVYTGVLYQHLDLPSLSPLALKRAHERLYVASALWGVLNIGDRIPAYRLSIAASLPRYANLAGRWRPHLLRALPRDALVVDLRSGGYAAAWRPPDGTVIEVTAPGLTHMVKAVRGAVARRLVEQQPTPTTPEEIVAVVEAAGGRAIIRP